MPMPSILAEPCDFCGIVDQVPKADDRYIRVGKPGTAVRLCSYCKAKNHIHVVSYEKIEYKLRQDLMDTLPKES